MKMYKLLQKVMTKEVDAGTYQPRRRDLVQTSFGQKITRDQPQRSSSKVAGR